MADNQGTYRIEIVVDGDDNINARINGLTKGYTTLAKAVSAANDKLKDQNKAHKGTANFYKEQIGYLEDLRDRLAKTTGETAKYNAAIERLQKRKAALSAPMKGTLAAFKLELQELRKQQAQVAKTDTQWDAYEKRIASVRANVDKLTGSQRIQTKTNQDMISNAGLAGATLTELGRTISDSNYGIRGMANNLSQLSTLFVTFVSKTEGGIVPALKQLGGQLFGPLGLILGFQIVVQQLEKYAMSQEKAANSAKNAAKEFEVQNFVLNEYVDILEDVNTSEDQRLRIISELISAVDTLEKADFDYGKNLDEVRKKIEAYTLAEAARAEVSKLQAENQELIIKKIDAQRVDSMKDEGERIEEMKKMLKDFGYVVDETIIIAGTSRQKIAAKTTEEVIGLFKEFKSNIDNEYAPIAKRIEELTKSFGIDISLFDENGKRMSDLLRDLNDQYEILMAERQEGGFVFDPFEGTQLGTLANEEEEQQPQEEETIQVSRPDDPYAVAPAGPVQPQPPVEEADESRLTITPDMIVTYPDSPYRTPDPYTADPQEAERLQEFFYTPRQEGMPKSSIDLEQDQQVTNAPFFITSGGVRVDFEADIPLTTKYRYMMANDGVAVPLSKEDGTLDMEGQDFLRYDLVPQKLYEQYTTPQVRAGALENVGGFLGDIFVGPTGRGDMQEADAYLKNIGLNQNARTYIMKGIATNEFELDSIIQGPADIAGFVLSLPAYAQKGVNFLMKDITLPFIGFLTGEDMTDVRKQAAKMQENQILNYEIPSYSQYIANKYDMLPEVVEYAIQPQGAISRAGKFLAEDLPLYAGAAALRVGSALRRMNELDIFMKRNHGGENFLESLKNASEKGIGRIVLKNNNILSEYF